VAGGVIGADKVFAYCERGSDPGFWAEPLNAVSNVAFIIAAILANAEWRRSRGGRVELSLVALVFVIGIGSFLFHTVATKWARIADVAPIGLFMLAYLGFSLRRFMALQWSGVVGCVLAFIAANALAAAMKCNGAACLNGSIGYLPALGALGVIAGILAWQQHAAAKAVGAACVVFALSLVCRTIDISVCPFTLIQPGWRLGTHALWHILNAIVLYLLLGAAVRYGDTLEMEKRLSAVK
jgi:hypothetical protein